MLRIDTAGNLGRDSRVIRDDDPFPYLVDRVEDQGGTVVVTYSNGDTVTYPSVSHPVIVVGAD